MTALLAFVRAPHFASLMLIFGGSAFAVLVKRAGLTDPPVKAMHVLFGAAATLALLSGAAWFCLIVGEMSGSWHGAIDPPTLELAASGTRFGQIFTARIIGLGALWLACVVSRRPHGPASYILAGLLLASLAPISHAAAGGNSLGTVGDISDALHLLTAGFWLGGLAVLALLMANYPTYSAELPDALRLFSAWGSSAVAVLVLTGLTNAFAILPVAAISFDNTYFGLLMLKIGLALAMIALAALNRWRLAPALRNGKPGAKRNLGRSVGAEIALGTTIVLIVGYLGLMAPE